MSEQKSEAKSHEDSFAEKRELNSKELVEKIEAYFYTDDGTHLRMSLYTPILTFLEDMILSCTYLYIPILIYTYIHTCTCMHNSSRRRIRGIRGIESTSIC